MERHGLYNALTGEQTTLLYLLESNDYNVYLFEQDKEICAEVQRPTDGGVDMAACLIPFNLDELRSYCNDFDIYDIIDLNRQDEQYCKDFTTSESVCDFQSWISRLEETINGY